MIDYTPILDFLERHINTRNIFTLLLMACAFFVGKYYSDAKRDKQEALLIYDHTKEIKDYCDSANSVKVQIMNLDTEYKLLLWSKDKKIDSLQQIIKEYENEGETE